VRVLPALVGLALIAFVLWDAFETVVLPRTVTRRVRLTRLYARGTWWPWAHIARTIASEGRRERFLAIYGPLSLLGLAAVWALGLIAGFAVVQWAVGSQLVTPSGSASFIDDLYMSGTTFFTLGLGDVYPAAPIARVLTVAEGGTGFAFLAIVIAYVPVLYQAFSRREVRLTLLDAWAGSPPAAAEVFRRLARANDLRALEPFLKDWEYWCSELLESHISYPFVAFFRSQHQRQSWVSALTTILDVSALVVVGIDGLPTWQAQITFAIARHAAVDLTQVFHTTPDWSIDRLSRDDLETLRRLLEEVGLRPSRSAEADARLAELRRLYEPFIASLGKSLIMPIPSWWRQDGRKDNWQSSPKRPADQHL
jgi:hypothetical protein